VIETIDKIAYTYQPVDLFVSSYVKIPSACLPTSAKTMQGLNSTLARIEAQEKNCFEALMLNIDGYIAEGSSCNIFWVKGEKIYTPSLDCDVLPGVMRDVVIRNSPFDVEEGKFNIEELFDADEVFLTNVAWVVAPVKSVKPDKFSWKSFECAANIRSVILDEMGV